VPLSPDLVPDSDPDLMLDSEPDLADPLGVFSWPAVPELDSVPLVEPVLLVVFEPDAVSSDLAVSECVPVVLEEPAFVSDPSAAEAFSGCDSADDGLGRRPSRCA
jgi:hypothetical protein